MPVSKFSGSKLPKLPVPPTQQKQENAPSQQPKPTNQTGPLNRLPLDVQLQIFSQLKPSDRMHVGQTCKQFNEVANVESLWKLECEKTLQFFGTPKETYKKHYQKETCTDPDRIYYVVGENIRISTKGISAFNTTLRKKVDKQEILDSFPHPNVRVFLKKEDAEEFAKSRARIDPNHYATDTAPAVFEVKINKSIRIDLKALEFVSKDHVLKVRPYFNTSSENISKISADMTGINQKVQLEDHGNIFSRAIHSITGKK